MGIAFITLRRRSPKLLAEIDALSPSAWRRIELDIPTRKYRCPKVYEQPVTLAERTFRQFYVLDLGHDKATLPYSRRAISSAAIHRYVTWPFSQERMSFSRRTPR